MRSDCLTIELKMPMFPRTLFSCRDIFSEMNTEKELENRKMFVSYVGNLATKPQQSELHEFCCKQS